jgi:microcompartment protein CcmL/EutN
MILLCAAVWTQPSHAADQNAMCDPKTALEEIEQNQAEADALMAYTVEALVRRLRCAVSTSVMDSIRKDPGSAEVLLGEKAPECYAKMTAVYDADTADTVQAMIDAVAEAMERVLMDRGCPRMHEEVAALIGEEYRHRVEQIQFMTCVNELRRLASAQSILYSEQNRYTDDIKVLAKWLAPTESVDQSAPEAEARVAQACCGAAGCDPDDESVAWDAQWGMELEDEEFALYGYPIGGPGCLIMVTPQGVDPTSVDLCIEESDDSGE